MEQSCLLFCPAWEHPKHHQWLPRIPGHFWLLWFLFHITASSLHFKPRQFVVSFSVLGSGMDPDLQMDIITELDLVNTTLGVTQVSGLHNASKAFLFQGKGASSLAQGTVWGRGQPGGCSPGVYLLEDHLCCVSCVAVIRNAQKCWGCADIPGVFWRCEGSW